MTTTIVEGWTTKFLNGMGAHLAAQGVGAWNPGGDYAPGDVGIVVDAIPDVPDLLITLTSYPVDDLPGIADVRVGVQVRCRGNNRDPRIRNDLADACYEALHGLSGVTWGGVAVVQVFRASWAPIGQDAAGRYERSDNYYVDAMRPNAFNTD